MSVGWWDMRESVVVMGRGASSEGDGAAARDAANGRAISTDGQPSPLTQSRTPDRVVDSELFAYPSRCNEYVI